MNDAGATGAKVRKTEFRLAGESRMPAPTMGRRAMRTSALIQSKAREVFLAKGYHGTNIEDIAEAAGVSRASFYTYFPSKRDVLLALGRDAYRAMDDVLTKMEVVADAGTADLVEQIVRAYLELLDEHGGFILIWGHAGLDDPALRAAGMRSKMQSARRMAGMLGVGVDEDAGFVGLAFLVMIDRFWYYQEMAGLPASREKAVETLSGVIHARISAEGSRSR